MQHGARLLRVTLPSPLVLTALGCRPYEALTTEAAAAVAQAEPSVELLDLSDADADGSATSTTLRAPKTLASAIADVRPSLSRIERRAEIVADVPALIGKLRALGVLGPAS